MNEIDSRTDRSFWTQWKKAELRSPGYRGWILFGGLKLCCQFIKNADDVYQPSLYGYLDWFLEDDDTRTLVLDEIAGWELLRHVH